MEEQTPLPLRIIEGFEQLQETDFWPSEITEASTALTKPMSFREFNEFMTNQNSNIINNMDRQLKNYMNEYNQYLTSLDRMPNVFSFDIDYI